MKTFTPNIPHKWVDSLRLSLPKNTPKKEAGYGGGQKSRNGPTALNVTGSETPNE